MYDFSIRRGGGGDFFVRNRLGSVPHEAEFVTYPKSRRTGKCNQLNPQIVMASTQRATLTV